MIGVILAAGQGSRLGEQCKPLIPLSSRPIIQVPLDYLVSLGCYSIVIVISDSLIPEALGEEYKGCSITYVIQEIPEGTAHALQTVKPLIDEPFYVICGDLLISGDLPSKFSTLTAPYHGLVLTAELNVSQVKRYAAVYANSQGLIESIDEKPDSPTTSCGEMGFYHFPREILDIPLKRGKSGEFELQSLENALIRQGVPLYSVPYSGNWVNVNTPDDLARARTMVAAQLDEEWERTKLP